MLSICHPSLAVSARRIMRHCLRKYLAGEVSIRGAAAEVGVDGRTIQQWAMQYESEGPGAFLPSMRNHTYSSALKVQVVQDYLSGGGSLLEVSKK